MYLYDKNVFSLFFWNNGSTKFQFYYCAYVEIEFQKLKYVKKYLVKVTLKR